MKIQRKGVAKAPVEVATTPTVWGRPFAEWEPYFEQMMKRPFGEFFVPWTRPFEFFAPWRMAGEFEPFTMRETEHGFVVSAAMPGFKETEVKVDVEPWRVYVHAEHKEASKKGEPVFEEYREFSRWIEFPAEVIPEKAKAVLSKGVLEVTVEKAQAAKRVEVQPKAA